MTDAYPNLQELVRRGGPLGYPLAVKFLLEVACQMGDRDPGELHGLDIRPSNIVITELGSARLRMPAELITETGPAHSTLPVNRLIAYFEREFAVERLSDANEQDFFETADYLTPERAISSGRSDQRADIYSLGCVLYFMLAGRPPFASGSISERLLAHQTSKPEPIGLVRADVPPALAAICARMLAKKPDRRFESMAALVSAISRREE